LDISPWKRESSWQNYVLEILLWWWLNSNFFPLVGSPLSSVGFGGLPWDWSLGIGHWELNNPRANTKCHLEQARTEAFKTHITHFWYIPNKLYFM
jgi:hypothetical protein